MDLIASCKEKLAHFRIRELKGILTELNLSKQGKKQDLIDRILAILSDERVSGMWSKRTAVGKEEVAKLVDDIYRKLQDSGATELASKGRGVSDSNNNTKHKEEIEVPPQVEKVRCPCGSSLKVDSRIQCEDSKCNVWQHMACVIIPEKPMEGILPVPPTNFYCELCRLIRADPFWVTVAHPLLPVKLAIANVPTDGTNPMQSIEKTFQLTRADRDMLVKPEYDVQAWCMLLNDKVSFRMQWPQFAELQINGVPMRVINRPGTQLLGANGRDDGPIITPCTRDGINKITFTGCDSRVFCVGVRIVKRRTVQQILNIIPKESDGERFEDALARIRRCVGGGAATDNADSDSDLEVVADNITVSLRCPMSGSRMKIAGRFKPCAHMGCFDLEVFVEMCQRSRKWQCPTCLKNYSLESVIIDPYFTRITSKMHSCGDDVTEIEVKPDGSWRAKSEDDRKSLGELGHWHLPDGTLCAPVEVESKPKLEALKLVKHEGGSEGYNTGLNLGILNNKNGIREERKPDNLHSVSSGMNNGHNAIPMSSSATLSGRDGEDNSVNQEGGTRFDFSTPNGLELDSLSLNIDRNFIGSAGGDADVIVLSDSEDENENLISSGQIFHNNNINNNNNNINPDGVPFSSLPLGITEPHPELGLLNTNDDDFGGSFWSLHSSNPCGPNFQFIGSDADPTDGLVDLHHGQLGSTSMGVGGYSLAGDPSHHQSMNINDGLVDNPLTLGGDDPSLQLFLPTRPSEATPQVDLTNQPPAMSNGFRGDDWISLSLGGGGSGAPCEPVATSAAATSGLTPKKQPPSKDGELDALADTASLLLGMREGRSDKISRERSDSPFSFPRQKRSVRPRYLSIDIDSGEDI
ncbi:putative chromatin regulator PHD family [Helianthus annuus]|uniref:Chromatin regulator PHD family n=1 Tax=Helianthus annuus TaxID=4232 RepID=A0A251VPJ6_HELAN|nr:E3 SUMO-protein ligase SIZ1 [Helianthus annuus]XP_021978732.1 E3 SUMO-protein ligase SIZ1 [Helianthus annuus]KAF5822839.1 putative chromatin regulator PHD family [Helianthus annuus]KAJ0612282.1 putative chromatin regulator PHD family [Helianthus annuus]KAJ0627625.1 putative chromatin regulator PHD family [Helianthus annuus]KAJ0783924.1 putative chromatin regulator PHD family [Helianthus annuus]KAJ0948859.1 putative chromatin regulator PHD family [Helianthus annuus]